jgi:hypothetical protein
MSSKKMRDGLELKIINNPAETVYINTPKDSYGIFCFNSIGDLFLNSDWGFYGFSWRHMGDGITLKEFIAGCNADYIADKFYTNINTQKDKKDFEKWRRSHVLVLINHFIDYCKSCQKTQ